LQSTVHGAKGSKTSPKNERATEEPIVAVYGH
jgi:hypothetical protein